jgi:hypothetical protein
LQDLPKFTQIEIFGFKMNHLATFAAVKNFDHFHVFLGANPTITRYNATNIGNSAFLE